MATASLRFGGIAPKALEPVHPGQSLRFPSPNESKHPLRESTAKLMSAPASLLSATALRVFHTRSPQDSPNAWWLGLKGITVGWQVSKPWEVLASGIAPPAPGLGSCGVEKSPGKTRPTG